MQGQERSALQLQGKKAGAPTDCQSRLGDRSEKSLSNRLFETSDPKLLRFIACAQHSKQRHLFRFYLSLNFRECEESKESELSERLRQVSPTWISHMHQTTLNAACIDIVPPRNTSCETYHKLQLSFFVANSCIACLGHMHRCCLYM